MANANYIPYPPFGNHQISLQANSHYGDNDHVQWPQPYLSFNSHFPAILHPNTLPDHDIIWWTLTPSHFETHLSLSSGLGKISESQFTTLSSSVSFLLDCTKCYQASANNIPFLIPLMAKWFQQVFDQLHYVHMSFCYAEFISKIYRECGSIFGLY